MSDSLTTLITRMQALLLDDGSKFTTPTCTAAIREALRQFNNTAPIHAGTLIDTISGDYEYALNATDFEGLLDVLNVFYLDEPISFRHYWMDNAPFIRLETPLPAGTAVLDVRFTLPHTINGLDSQTESTLDSGQDQVLVDGACAQACYIRSTSRVEAVNLAGDTTAAWKAAGDTHLRNFQTGLVRYARRPAPTALPDPHAWNDPYHNWQV